MFLKTKKKGNSVQKDKLQQLVKIAELYYLEDMKQSDIAKKFGIARSSVSMQLTQARELGIVKIDVCDPFRIDDKYSAVFHDKYGIDKCYTVRTTLKESEDITDLIAKRAGEIFDEKLEDDLTIGIAWGMACYKFIINCIENKKFSNLTIVPLLGGIDLTCYMHPQNEMIRQFADKLGGTAQYIYAPLWASSKKERDMYLNSSAMQKIKSIWEKIDIAILGIGSEPRQNKLFLTDEVTINDDYNLSGDLCGLFFDDEGNFPKNSYNDRTVGISVELLKNVPEVISIAGGDFKKRSIMGALKTGAINTFITDSKTAKALL